MQTYRRTDQASKLARDDRGPSLNCMDAIEIPSSRLYLPLLHDVDDLHPGARVPALIQEQDNPRCRNSSPEQRHFIAADHDSNCSDMNGRSTPTQAKSSDTPGSQLSINAADRHILESHSMAERNEADPPVSRQKFGNADTAAAHSKTLTQKPELKEPGNLPLVGPLLWLYRKKKLDTSALFESVESGNTSRLTHLLGVARIYVNVRNESSKTLQMQAAVHGQVNCLEILRHLGADELATDSNGRTVLHLAVEHKQIAVVSWLLHAYAPSPEELSHKSPRFVRASGLRSRGRLSQRFLDASDREGLQALHIAALVNFDKVVRQLVEAGSNLNSRNKIDRTPLHEAILSNHYNVTNALISNGADINTCVLGQVPLYLAARSGKHEMVNFLIEKGANKMGYNSSGNMPIHGAAMGGHLKAIEELVRERADLNAKTRFGGTLLHIAVLEKNIHLAQYLLQQNVEVNPWGTFPLKYLSAHFGYEMRERKLFLSLLANSRSTPLHYSCYHGNFRLTSLLLDHGAWVNAPVEEGMTPLMMAVDAEDLDLVCLFLSKGAGVNASLPRTYLTALHHASALGNEPIVRELIQQGANIKAKTVTSLTPVEYAITKMTAKPEHFAKLMAIIRCFVLVDGTQLERAIHFCTTWPDRPINSAFRKYLYGERLRIIAAASGEQSSNVIPTQCDDQPWLAKTLGPIHC